MNCLLEDFSIELSAKKVNGFGFYDTCVSDKSRRYYLLSQPTIGGIWTSVRPLNFFGVCGKKPSCSEQSIIRVFEAIFEQLQDLKTPKDKATKLKVYKFPDHLEHRIKPFSSLSFYFLSILAMILLFSVLSTIMVKILKVRLSKEAKKESLDQEDLDPKLESAKIENEVKRSFWAHFDLSSNLRKITSPPKFSGPISQTFTVARPLAMALVMFLHQLSYKKDISTLYGADYKGWQTYEKTSPATAFAQMGHYAVGVFFFMGGYVSIIASEGFINKARKAKRSLLQTYLFMVARRYVRFAPILLLVELYTMRVLNDVGSSPFTPLLININLGVCRLRLLFKDMFLLNPLVLLPRCTTWTWYVMADFNLYMLMVLVVMVTRTPIQRNLVMIEVILLGLFGSALTIYTEYLKSGGLSEEIVIDKLMHRYAVYFLGGILGYNLKLVRERRKGVDSRSEMKTLDHNIELTQTDQDLLAGKKRQIEGKEAKTGE